MDPQEEGAADRLALGIDGTMGDAMDIAHPFLPAIRGCCRVCGLAEPHRKHVLMAGLRANGSPNLTAGVSRQMPLGA